MKTSPENNIVWRKIVTRNRYCLRRNVFAKLVPFEVKLLRETSFVWPQIFTRNQYCLKWNVFVKSEQFDQKVIHEIGTVSRENFNRNKNCLTWKFYLESGLFDEKVLLEIGSVWRENITRNWYCLTASNTTFLKIISRDTEKLLLAFAFWCVLPPTKVWTISWIACTGRAYGMEKDGQYGDMLPELRELTTIKEISTSTQLIKKPSPPIHTSTTSGRGERTHAARPESLSFGHVLMFLSL